ncbi:hypothetical protein SLE2022_273680 [Rubroshorea leprosula]
MRSGACTVQQTLTTEAASVLKHSLSLARRRGHAQVTPLHVAATLLASRVSLLRRACLKSQPHHNSHPLQCRALELCFNVALNRLPTITGPPLHGQPSLSNALIAALKRAQAHQRRGCIEQQQQQPLLTIKVELEQLIISILDDPSVSRVMREAGFSSTAVKSNIEDSSASSVFQCYSTTGGVFSSPCSPSPTETQSSFWPTPFLAYSSEQNQFLFSPQKKVPVADSTSVKEDIKLVFEVFLGKKRKNTVIVGDSLSITEGLIAELMGRVERGDVPEGMKHTEFIKFYFAPVALRLMKKEDVEMNITDLKRKVNSVTAGGGGAMIYTGDLRWTVEESLISGYNPVDHLVSEVGRLVSDYNSSNTKVWLVATASYQTYMRCQMKQPPLEIQWALQAVSVPSGGLGLTLHASSVHDSRITVSPNPSQVLETKPFGIKEENDKLSCCAECTSNYEKEAEMFKSNQQKLLPSWLQSHGRQKEELLELKKKWSRLCHSLHQLGNSTFYSNRSSWSYSHNAWWPGHKQSCILPDSVPSVSFSKPNLGSHLVAKFRRQNSCSFEFNFGKGTEPSLDQLKNSEGKEVKIDLSLGNSQFFERDELRKLLQENVPWQHESIPSIVEALMDESPKNGTWILIQGNDTIGKRRLARAIAESVSGSADSLLLINMGNGTEATPSPEMLMGALRNKERLVVLMENVDLADARLTKSLPEVFEELKKESIGRQPIFILTKSDPDGERKKHDAVIQMTLKVNAKSPNTSIKRKAEWDFSNKTKSPKTNTMKDLSLDLNIKVEEDFEESPISRFLNSIPNRYIFNENPSQYSEMKEEFTEKMRRSMEEIIGAETATEFSVEDRVLDEILGGCGSFVNSQFEKWLKYTFQRSLETVKKGGKEGIVEMKLCYGGKGEQAMEDGFEGSCLPYKIQLSSMD